jgi:drug/metabolite transporter (DMT)-like permease
MAGRVPFAAYLCLAASMALVGSYVGLSKLLLAVLPVFLLAWLRCAIAAAAMMHWIRRRDGEVRLLRHDRLLLFWESFLGNFLFTICMLFGISQSTALAAGVIMAAMPAVVALLSWAFLRERITPRVAAGIAFAVAGIALVSATRTDAGSGAGTLLGNALLFAATVCEASYVVIGKKLTGNVSPRRISALVNLWSLALLTPIGVWQATRFDFTALPGPIWPLLLFYSLAASMWTVWLWMTGLKAVPASRAGVFTVMLPITAAAVGIVFLGERLSGAQLAAFALSLTGLLLATWPAASANKLHA